MKVCILIHSLDKSAGGPSRSVPILARGLSELGLEITLMVIESENMNLHTVEGTQINIIKLPQNISKAQLKEYILSGHFDLVHLQMIWKPLYHYASLICRDNKIPYMITPRGTLEPWAYQGQGFLRNLKKKIAMIVYQRGDLQNSASVLATARNEARNLRALGITAPIAVIPNGIDISQYQCRAIQSKSSIKKQILFLSRIHQKKGIELLILAWKQLKEKYPDWNIVIAGNGEESYIQHLNTMIVQQNLQNSIKIMPPVFGEEKNKLYYQSSLFILPSYSENFGMVIAEAMCCGVPVITTNQTPWQDLNRLGIGWCIDLSVENLVKTVSEAIDLGMDELFEKGQRCGEYVRQTYQYTEIAAKNRAVYEWLLGVAPKPGFVTQINKQPH